MTNTRDWHREETYKSMVQIATNGLKFILIANGGAAIAILAFLGKVYAPGNELPPVSSTLLIFLAGVFSGGFAHFTAYITQFVLYNEHSNGPNPGAYRKGAHKIFLGATVLLLFAGLVFFGIGAYLGVNAISSYGLTH